MAETCVVNVTEEKADVFIGRPSKWRNPFVPGRDGTREQVIEKYERHVRSDPALMRALPSLHGKRLGCFCAPAPCHGDVLVRLVEELYDHANG